MFGLSTVSVVAGAFLGAVVAGTVGLWVGHHTGYSSGYAASQLENKQADFDQAKERQGNDSTVEKMSDADLCRILGGELQPDGSCN